MPSYLYFKRVLKLLRFTLSLRLLHWCQRVSQLILPISGLLVHGTLSFPLTFIHAARVVFFGTLTPLKRLNISCLRAPRSGLPGELVLVQLLQVRPECLEA